LESMNNTTRLKSCTASRRKISIDLIYCLDMFMIWKQKGRSMIIQVITQVSTRTQRVDFPFFVCKWDFYFYLMTLSTNILLFLSCHFQRKLLHK
jgi:hypothetical protein